MNSMDNNILAKFLLGEADAQERKQVLSWLAASDENRRLFDQFEKTWAEAGMLSPKPIDVDVDAAWNKVAKLTVDNNTRKLSFPRWAAAAAVILLVGLIGLLRNSRNNVEPEIFANATETAVTDSLPDGSTIILAANSTVEYSFDKRTQTRKAQLKGDAFFSVKRDESQQFVVDAGIGGVQVLGTSFNVKSLDDEDIQVDVLSGVVRLYYPLESGDTLFLTITKGESGLISGRLDSVMVLEQPSDAFFLTNKSLSFNDVPLDSVFSVLSACYSTTIIADDAIIGEFRLTSNFKNETINNIIEVITGTFDLSYIKTDNAFIIKYENKE